MKKWIFILSLMLCACGKNLGTDESRSFKFRDFLTEQVSFEELKQNILEPKCMSCHEWAGDEAEVLSRVEPGKPETSELYEKIVSGEMPMNAPELNAQEKLLLYFYIAGLPGRSDGGPDPVDRVALNKLKQDIFIPKCLRCHAWVSDDDKILSRVRPGQPEASRLYLLVKNNRMPVGGPPLSDQEKLAIFEFIQAMK